MQLDAPALSGAAMETEMEENRDGGGSECKCHCGGCSVLVIQTERRTGGNLAM